MKNIQSISIAFSLIFFIFTTSLSGQFTSSITHPDDSEIKIDDLYAHSLRINPEALSKHLYTLASDEFGGRELGTEGNAMASEYISKHFADLGMSYLPGTSSYFQDVDFTWISWGKVTMNVDGKKYKQLWDFVAFQDKNKGVEINTNEVIYLGYGIDDPSYSDYKRAKVNGKVVLIYDGEPIDNNGKYRINGDGNKSRWSKDISHKLNAAKEHGVKHVLIVAPNIQDLVKENRRQLLGAKVILGKPEALTSPVDYTYISSSIAKRILGKKTKKVIQRKKCITKKGLSKPVKAKTNLHILQKKKVRQVSGHNIAAMIEGKEYPDEYIFITAHYDHIGKKGKDINNGADDNASGTSSILEMARAYKIAEEYGYRPKRSIVFMLVTGEEKGLLGSKYYVENPIIPLEKTVVDINIDMVGRVHKSYKDNPNYIFVIGSDRLSKELHIVNEVVNQNYSKLVLDYKYNDAADPNRFYFRSDHYSFAKKGIPAIFFFNGTHEDYHRPTDTADKINYEKMSKVVQHIFRLSWKLGDMKNRIVVDQ